MAKATGYVIWEGASKLDGAPVVVIATMGSKNAKTGDMVQTWILRQDVEPHAATKTGQDSSVCGDCPHRHHTGGACYVTTFQAPLAIYRAYKRGNYSRDVAEFLQRLDGRRVRFGAYGDPAAAPFDVWQSMAAAADGHTGYTHQAAHAGFDPRLLQLVMQSVDTAEQAKAAEGRYFRVKRAEDAPLPGEVECLADSVGKSCAECLLCDGTARGKGKSVYITVHGAKAAKYDPNLIAAA